MTDPKERRTRLPVANINLVKEADDLLGDIERLLEGMMQDAPMSTDGRVSRSARAIAKLNKARLLLRDAADLKRSDIEGTKNG